MKPVILVIDDNPKVVESLAMTLPEYEFLGAGDGPSGLKLLEKPNVIDAVILDYRLGEADGIEILRKIRENCPALGVILLTSYGSKDVAVQALRAHADDFVDKPCDAAELKSKIDALVASAKRRESVSGGLGAVRKITHLLERNYHKDVTLTDVASGASLSPKYLSRKFQQETGLGFSEYKVRVRVRRAKEFLADSAWTVAQVAQKVGYENTESFVKAFKKASGLTPTEFRSKNPAAPRASSARA